MFFPLFVDLSEKKILIVGAGTIAERRICTLCGFAGHMTVVAPVISSKIKELAKTYPIVILEREFLTEDPVGQDMVLAATNDEELNQKIYMTCREKGIPVNNCSDQSMCDFQFPSIVKEGEVVIGINSSGKNHCLVKETRQKVEKFLKNVDNKR